MTKFSFALVVMLTSAGSLCAGQEDPLWRRIAPCPVGNGEDRGGSLPQSATEYAGQFPGAGYIPTAKKAELATRTMADHIAAEKAILAAENARIAAENARIKAAISKAHADARALEAAIASLEAEIAGLNETSAAQSASSSRSGSRPASRAGCMSPIARTE